MLNLPLYLSHYDETDSSCNVYSHVTAREGDESGRWRGDDREKVRSISHCSHVNLTVGVEVRQWERW